MCSTGRRWTVCLFPIVWSLNGALQCDTFSRSSDAVFELSMRFVEPFTQSPNLSDAEKLEAERLMFLELTQGQYIFGIEGTTLIVSWQFASGVIRLICRFSSI